MKRFSDLTACVYLIGRKSRRSAIRDYDLNCEYKEPMWRTFVTRSGTVHVITSHNKYPCWIENSSLAIHARPLETLPWGSASMGEVEILIF